jgi:putative hydrolase of HD superfamily
MRDESSPPILSERGADDSAPALLRFFHLAGRLKDTPRAGWALRGVSAPESVAEHSWRMALLALVLAPRVHPPVDAARCLALALVHDLAESLVGDITPYDNVPADEKRRREEAAMLGLAALAGDESLAALWREYDAAESPEARFVKELDKLETVLQAAEYEQRGDAAPGALHEFWANAGARVTSPVARALLDALQRESAEVRECGSAFTARDAEHEAGDGG